MSDYLSTENGTANNAVHWSFNPLDPKTQAVLRRIHETGRLQERERFETAYLVARGCLKIDLDAWTFEITAKGKDAIAFYQLDRP